MSTQKRSDSTTSSKAAQIDLPGSLESALKLLRLEWRDRFSGQHARRALRAVKHAQSLSTDEELAIALARIEARLDAYLTLTEDARSDALKEIGAAIKHLHGSRLLSQELVRPLAGAASAQLGTLTPLSQVRPNPRVGQLPLSAPVTRLPRVGPAVAKKLGRLAISSVGDLLRSTPRRHIDYSNTMSIRDAAGFIQRGEVTIKGTVTEVSPFSGPPARVTIRLSDSTGVLRVTWFNPYIGKQLRAGEEIAVSGMLDHGYGTPAMTSPEWERIGPASLSTGRLTPVYSLTQGVAQKTLRSLTRAALDATRTTLVDHLPDQVRRDNGLMPLAAAFEEMHYPQSEQNLRQAMKRLAFDDLLLLQLGMVRVKQKRERAPGIPFQIDRGLLIRFFGGLPFQLTAGQIRALDEVINDLSLDKPMVRLLQGDVGSGKTVVAAAAALCATANSYQVAVLAPTEILAEQHFESLQQLFATIGPETRPVIAILTGSSGKRSRNEVLAGLECGDIDVLIGTHALIQKDVEFQKLGLLIVDEQHRFGVRQRSHLPTAVNGPQPHVLSMTATPIPRTLNMVLNGDTDVSVIDELPKGRVPIETSRYTPGERAVAYELVRTEIAAGRQAFVICPLVDESESTDAKAATTEAERLQAFVFPELRVQVLHGRMPGKEKDRVMTAFRERQYDILVSTSVIEVGIDIPNATIMMIEGANRFGLAQLHQFRGRVGRSRYRSYCLLIADESSPDAEQRLAMMVASNDGFALAQKDLELRGPGDFIGTRQSGLPDMPALAGAFDTRILDAARRSAEHLLDRDPELEFDDHQALRSRLQEFWLTAAPDLPLR
ncbi:ATP-dependent DNA helicase RecG [soil metagenome]